MTEITVVREPDNLDWMSALSDVIGNNDTPWWGSDVTITPLNEYAKGSKDYKNVGYVIKINGWEHLAIVYKRDNSVFRIATPDRDWRRRCDGNTRYNDFDENREKKVFWEATVKLLRDHVKGEENLGAYVERSEKSCD